MRAHGSTAGEADKEYEEVFSTERMTRLDDMYSTAEVLSYQALAVAKIALMAFGAWALIRLVIG